jgi:G:T-mismatch repair DNA endonuclease (very short patch repair protein)
MTGRIDRATRSRVMAAVRSANTEPEMQLRRHLFAQGYRYRLQVKGLPRSASLKRGAQLARRLTAFFLTLCCVAIGRRGSAPSDLGRTTEVLLMSEAWL